MLSVLIPSREEIYLQKTIDSVLSAAKGEIEVIAVLDGYWPDPPIKDDPRVVLIHHDEAIGQRPAVNEAARAAKGKYILKTDAHSMFDEGFDLKLAADCEYDWTVIPRMYNLDAINWKRKLHKVTDFMWINAPDAPNDGHFKPFRVHYWDAKTKRKYPEQYAAHKKNIANQGDVCDVMTAQGACFFMHKDRFWELGGMDEGHGHWGQMGIEVALKAWLSGGRQVVNKKTWFAHYFRGGGGPGFPWPPDGKQQEEARKYSRKLWTSGVWPLQKKSLDWLVEKFAPLPNWNGKQYPINNSIKIVIPENKRGRYPVHRTSISTPKKLVQKEGVSTDVLISVIMPARNEKYMQKTIDGLAKNMKTEYEVLVGLDNYTPDPPLKNDPKVTVYHSDKRVGSRVLLNKLISMAKGKFIMRLDPHCKIAKGLDAELLREHKPGCVVVPRWYELDVATWKRRDHSLCDYRYLTHPDAAKGGLRSLQWRALNEKYKHLEVDEVMTCSGSLWLVEKEQLLKWGGLDEGHGQIGQEGVEIACKAWLSGGKMIVNKRTWYAHWNRTKSTYAIGSGQKKKSLAHSLDLWPNNKWPLQKKSFQWLVDHFRKKCGRSPGWSLKELEPVANNITYKFSYGFKSKVFRVDELYENFEKYARSYKRDPKYIKSVHEFQKHFRPFVDAVLVGEIGLKTTEEELRKTGYFLYLCHHLHKARHDEDYNPDRIGLRRVLKNIKNSINLIKSVRAEGIHTPLDMWKDGKDLVLQRGQRRVVIAKKLGIKTLVARIFKSRDVYNGVIGRFDERSGGPIEKAAQRQFGIHGRKATDKYYVHNYTHLYDKALAHLVNKPIKILEIGVKDGASLRIWNEAFPKAKIYGIDIKDVSNELFLQCWTEPELFVGSQSDVEFLKNKIIPHGPFDVIIDDGSHQPKDVAVTLDALWPALAGRGVYVIEDLWHAVHHSADKPFVIDRLNKLVGRVYSSKDVLSVECYLNICLIGKA